MTELRREVVEFSMEAFVNEIVVLTLDGWKPVGSTADVLPSGNSFMVTMIRNDDTVAKLKSAALNAQSTPKPTRAEILQKARDAKKAKLDVSTVK